MSWEYIQLGKIADFKNGVNFNKSSFGEGIKVINVSDFKDYLKPKFDELSEINPEGIVNKSTLLKEDDILFVRSNGNKALVGRSILIEEIFEDVTFSAFCIRCRFNNDQIHPKFYAYLFRTDYVRTTLSSSAVGTNINNLNQGLLNSLKVPFPPLPTQRRIASILSAYDDLIKNNLRRIKLLEEAAQHIYREWFVRMRFPGWEGAKFGEDGVPEGWRKVPVEEIIEYHIGGGWGNDDVDGDYVQPAFVIRGTDIPKLKTGSAESVPFRYHTVSNFKSRRLQENDLVFEVSGGSKGQPVGRSLLVTNKILELFGEQEVICASFCKLIRIDSYQVSPYYFDAYILEVYGNGVLSQYENQSASNIMNFKFTDFISKEYVVVPSQPIQKMFDKLVQPLKNQIGNLAIQINRLKEARDILLPRLMNQTIEV